MLEKNAFHLSLINMNCKNKINQRYDLFSCINFGLTWFEQATFNKKRSNHKNTDHKYSAHIFEICLLYTFFTV